MSNPTDSIEVTAPTVEAAVQQALERLGAQADDVAIEVLSTPRSGVLGLGARQAKVRVTRRPPEAAQSVVMSPPPAPPPKPREPAPSRSRARPAASATPAPARPLPPPVVPLPAEERPAMREMPAEEEALIESLAEEPAGEADEDTRQIIDVQAQLVEGQTVLAEILTLMGEKAAIEVARDDDPELLELNIKGDGSGLLIGRHGQTLDALEYLVNRILARRIKDAAPISIDTESYRARRRGQLHRMALSKGEEAKREHQAVTLDPMPPRDRRIIHLALKDDPLLTTRSAGDGFLRSIQIVPTDERRESGGGGGPGGRDRRRGRGNGPREAGPRDTEPRDTGPRGGKPREENQPVGEQGGFRHGQKRIV